MSRNYIELTHLDSRKFSLKNQRHTSSHAHSLLKATPAVNLHQGSDNLMTHFPSTNPTDVDTPELLAVRLQSQRAHFYSSCPNEKHSIQTQL